MLCMHGREEVESEGSDKQNVDESDNPFEYSCCVVVFLILQDTESCAQVRERERNDASADCPSRQCT